MGTDNIDAAGYEDAEEYPIIELPMRATFADLFSKMEEMEEDGNGTRFEEDLVRFAPEIEEKVLSMRGQAEAAGISVLDFFKQHDHPRRDVEIFLPVRFVDEMSQ